MALTISIRLLLSNFSIYQYTSLPHSCFRRKSVYKCRGHQSKTKWPFLHQEHQWPDGST